MKKVLISILLCVGVAQATCVRDSQQEIVVCSDTYVGELTWQDNQSAKSVKMRWGNAKEYCSSLSHAGFNDWRLPSIEELRSIVDFTRYNPSIKKAFNHTAIDDLYWSSTVGADNSSYAWFVNFSYGYDDRYVNSYPYYVRCVR